MDKQRDPNVDMPAATDVALGEATVGADLDVATAEREIAKAVSARHSIARAYVRRVRLRHPEASPTEIVRLLERHYVTAISVAGGVATIGSIAASIGLSLIPGASAGKEAGKVGAKVAAKKVAAKATAKAAAKAAAANMARTGVARMVPAGDERLQFEITAIFALALAEIHSMHLDQDQSKALVYGLSNDRVSQTQISTMATDVARATRSASGLGSNSPQHRMTGRTGLTPSHRNSPGLPLAILYGQFKPGSSTRCVAGSPTDSSRSSSTGSERWPAGRRASSLAGRLSTQRESPSQGRRRTSLHICPSKCPQSGTMNRIVRSLRWMKQPSQQQHGWHQEPTRRRGSSGVSTWMVTAFPTRLRPSPP